MLTIAVIGPGQSVSAIKEALEAQAFDCQFQYHTYDLLEEILPIYKAHHADWAGIIFSGELSYRFFLQHVSDQDLPLKYLDIDPKDFYGQLLKFLEAQPDSTLNRVYVDFISESNAYLGLKQFIMPDHMPKHPKTFIFDGAFYQMTLEEIKALWTAGKIDMVFTRITNNISKLVELGIPYVHLYPPAASIQESFRRAIDEISLYHLNHNQLAIGHLELLFSDLIQADYAQTEYFEITMHKHLVDFRHQSQMNFSIQKLSYGFELTFSRRELGMSSEHYHFPLLTYLETHYSGDFNLGIGLGTNVEEGRYQAIEALAQARHFGVRHGFVVDQNHRIWGPIGQPNCIEYRPLPTQIERMSKQLSISPKNLERLLAYAKSTSFMTSDQVAESLNITIRSANRILSRLHSDGLLMVLEDEAAISSGAGRPSKKYVLNVAKLDQLEK